MIAASAARWVVEDGLDYGAAKRRAVRDLGLSARAVLPSNERLEDAVREYIAVFCSESQARELLVLRRLALDWMNRLAAFRPYLTGAVWNGTATRCSDIHLQLFCDDPKSAEIGLIDQGVRYQARCVPGGQTGMADVLSLQVPCPDLQEDVGVHLMICDHDDLRSGGRASARGRPLRGDARAVQRLLQEAS